MTSARLEMTARRLRVFGALGFGNVSVVPRKRFGRVNADRNIPQNNHVYMIMALTKITITLALRALLKAFPARKKRSWQMQRPTA